MGKVPQQATVGARSSLKGQHSSTNRQLFPLTSSGDWAAIL